MLNIRRVYGENFCQYPTFDYTLGQGLICLMASNGKGKSNFVRSLLLSLEGEVFGPGNLVKDGRLKGFVAMDIDSPRGSFTLRRELKYNSNTGGASIKHSLEASWLQEPLTKKADILAFMSPWIGTPGVLQLVNFALQGKFAELITCEHMQRAKMLNALMGHDRAERLRGVLQDAGRRIADLPDRQEAIDALTVELDELERLELELVAKRNSAKAQMTPQVEGAYTQARLLLAKPSSTLRDADLATQRQLLSAAKEAQAQADRELEATPERQPMDPPDENGYACHQRYVRDKELFENAQENLRTLPPPPNPDDFDQADLDAKNKRIEELNIEVYKINDKICSAGEAVCPTCKRPYHDMVPEIDVEALKAERLKLQGECNTAFNEVQGILRLRDEQVRKRAAWETTKANIESSVVLHKRNMEQYAEFAAFDVEAHMQNRELYKTYAADVARRLEADKRKLQADRLVDSINNEIVRISSADVATPEQHDWARKMVTTYEDLEKQYRDADSALKLNLVNKSSRRERQAELRQDMIKREINVKARNLLEFGREQLHAERLPRLAAQSSIGAINSAMRKYLDMFSFPYPFYLNPDLDFVFDRPYAKGVAAEGLSGGELVRAALAMRFALMEVFKAGCGILVIDEPTTFLDTEARTALVEVLGQAAGYFKHTQVKIICPTHAPELAGAADQIILIGEENAEVC